MRKINLPGCIFIFVFTILGSMHATAQSCCPEFEMQFPKFNCETPDCPRSSTGQPGSTLTMCQYSTNKIQVVPGITPGFTYSWTVTGGTINGNVLTSLNTSLSYIDVTWGNGSLGTVKVTIYNNDSSCFKVLTQSFCLTKSPKALFVKNSNDTVCKNQAIVFTNTSLGVYTNWFWDFGDGNTQNGGMTVSHAYASAGTYIVSLTVSNSKDQSNCGCSNTYYDTITVDNSTGLQILSPDCRKMFCAGDTVTYCSSITGCSSYNWSALGGTILGSGSCIKVIWNTLSSSVTNPTVSLTIPPSCAGSCGNSTSLVEKILYSGMPILGNNIVCLNAATTFTLPTLPGVFYNWSISPATGYTIINGTDINTPAFGVIFTAAGSYTITCNYIDSLRNCSGSSTKTVLVRPSYNITGPSTSCVTCISSFTTSPPGAFNWNINTVPVATASGPGISHTWTSTQTGTFTVTATQIGTAFCNSPQQAMIVVAPKPVLAINQSTNIACNGTVVKFWVTSTVPDMNITWTLPPGAQVINNPGPILDTIYVTFNGSGTQIVTASQSCKYSCASTSISASVAKPAAPVLLSPKTTVCIDEVVSYAVSGPIPGVIYNWSITNPNLGTIQSGQGTPNITVLWHGNASNTGILKVSHCNGSASANITVTLPMAVSISQSGACVSNGIGYTLTANPSGQTYLWSTTATTQSINVTSPGVYSVTVNPGGGGSCPVTKSITIYPDGYELAISPPCIVSNCNLSSFSIPLTQVKFSMPCAATFQWFFKPVGSLVFSPIPLATNANYNATQLGCYKCVATCANGCNITSNTICIPDDIYFCCSTAACGSLTFGIDFNYTGCSPTLFNGFYTGTGSPTGNFPIYYCYGDGTSELLPTLTAPHQYGAAGQYTVCISTKTLVFNAGSGTNDTCCISQCRTIDVPLVAGLNAAYNCNTGILSMSDASSYYPNSTGATYSWSVTGGSYTGTLGNSTSESISPTSSGAFIITLTVTKGTCTSTYSKVVNVIIPNASFTVNPNPTCSRDIASFTAAPGYASYYWQFGDGSYSYSLVSTQHQYTNNTNSPINVTASLTVTTPDGCTSTKTQVVTVHPKPIVTVTPNPVSICKGGSITLTANINPNGNTMCTFYNYQWMKNGVAISGATSSTYTATDYGLYSVFVSGATPGCNCSMVSDTAVVKLYPDPVAKIESSSTVCFDPASNPWSFSLTAANYPGYTYNWSCSIAGISFSPNGTSSNFTSATGTLVNNSNFIIYLQVVDANGCVADDSICIYTYANPSVVITAAGTMCANSIHTLSVTPPVSGHHYTWNTGASGTTITTTLAGNYYATAINLLTGCSAMSNTIYINESPSLQLFPIGCDTLCSDRSISIPLAQLPNLSNYMVQWYDGIKPAGTLIYSGPGAITIPGNFLSLGIHHLWTTVSFPNGCVDSSGVYDVFIRKCCNCAGSSWAFRQYSTDNGASWQNLPCGQGEVNIGCNPIQLNAAYNCSPGGCSGQVTGQLLDNLGNVILNIPSLPYTYVPAPGSSGSIFIKLIGWCDGVKCDSCITPVFYHCPLPEPPCACDTAFHFTGQPIIVIPPDDNPGFIAGGTLVPVSCGSTYPSNLDCQKPYQFFINYQHPWPSGNCQTSVLGEVILAGNVVYTQNNITQANPLNYTFPGQGLYCVKFKLIVNGTVCDSCIICFNVVCNVTCTCTEGFHFTGSPIIQASLQGAGFTTSTVINFPPPINCNTSLARPLMCNTSYSFSINYSNPYQLPCVARDSAVIIKTGIATPLVINPNTSPGNPITYTFTSSGTYCVKHYLTVNGVICDSCIICFSVECPNPCNCNAFDFTSEPTIGFSMGSIRGVPVMSYQSSGCETSLAGQLQCKRRYSFFINAGPVGVALPAGCVASVNATLLLNNVPIATLTNVSPSNPLNYTFSREGIYCIRYELYVNGVLCKTCTQCFFVKCCPVYYSLPPLRGNFVGCVIGGTTQIYNDSTGGTFRSLDTTVARVDQNGVVTAVGYGRATIVYNWIKNPCDYYVVAEYVVPQLTALPAITGNGVLCKVGDSSRFVNTVSLGTWSSNHPDIASVSTGTTRVRATQVKGISAGMATISYTVMQSGCPVSTTKDVLVNNIVMDPITGPSGVCIGRTISLQNATPIPGGYSSQWSSSNSRAIVDGNGVVTGVSAGSSTLTYQLNYTNPLLGSCSSKTSRDISILSLPSTPSIYVVIKPVYASNSTSICMNQSFLLRGSITGGTWTSAGSLTVNGNGVVTASSPGTGTVTYTVYNSAGCSSSRTLTYHVVSCDMFTKNQPKPSSILSTVIDKGISRIILYPNPAKDIVYYQVEPNMGQGTMTLLDMHGKRLTQSSFKPGINKIETGTYASGMYMVIFRSRNGIQTEKLVIR